MNLRHTALIIILPLILFLSASWFFYKDVPPNKDFAWLVKNALPSEGDEVLLKDLKPGTWTTVCHLESDSITDEWTPSSIAKRFEIPLEQLNIIGPIAKASDFESALIFFYPPSTVEVMIIYNDKLMISSLHRSPYDKSWPHCTEQTTARISKGTWKRKDGTVREHYFITSRSKDSSSN